MQEATSKSACSEAADPVGERIDLIEWAHDVRWLDLLPAFREEAHDIGLAMSADVRELSTLSDPTLVEVVVKPPRRWASRLAHGRTG